MYVLITKGGLRCLNEVTPTTITGSNRFNYASKSADLPVIMVSVSVQVKVGQIWDIRIKRTWGTPGFCHADLENMQVDQLVLLRTVQKNEVPEGEEVVKLHDLLKQLQEQFEEVT